MKHHRNDHEGRDGGGEPSGPVPVRDLMRPAASTGGEAEQRETPACEFEVNGEEWIARLAGDGAYGTGPVGMARLSAVHFCRADVPHDPLFEALIPAGRFEGLYAEELAELLRGATPIEVEES